MSLHARIVTSLALLAGTAVAAVALIRGGLYGWTIFVATPVILGGIAAWLFQPKSTGGAAFTGALGTAAGSVLLLLLGMEGLVCIVMAVPLACPLGALGGVLVYQAQRSVAAGRGSVLLLLLPPASIT